MHLSSFFSASSGSAWAPLADAVVKATLMFAAAGLAAFALRRASAASRHLVWTLALLSALALPALSVALPRWQLPIVTLSSESAAVPSAHVLDATAPSAQNRDLQPSAPREIRNQAATDGAPAPALSAAPRANESSSFSFSMPWLPRFSWGVLALVVWAAGAAAVLGRIALGLLAVQWMSRRTERVGDAPWLPLARQLAGALDVSPKIVFLRSGRATMPMAWGIFRPAVLMPGDADAWPAERLRIVLLHELAHVKRRDCLTHMLAQAACAVYWFNPLAWIAARHARTERERACDDLVLAAGTRGADYADQLLEVARVMRSGRFPAVLAGASLAMAHRSQLEGRLMAILDPSVPRSGVTRRRTLTATVLFALTVMPLASVQPWVVAATAEHSTSQQPSAPAAVASASASAQSTAQPAATEQAEAARVSATASRAGSIASTASRVAASAAAAAVGAAVQDGLHQGLSALDDQDVNATINSTINSNINSNINSRINTTVNTMVGVHVGAHEMSDDQDAKAKAVDPRMVAALTAALKDTDKDVRETALQALVRMRDPSIFEPLVQALSDAAADVREQAAHGLGQLRDRRAITPLSAALKDQNGDVREQAAFALGQLRDPAAVAALTAALKDSDDDVREQAVFALGQIRDPAALEGLVAATHDAKPDVRQQAVFSLGQLRDRRAVESLVSALKDTAADVREQAAFALGQIRDRGAVEALVIALKDSVPDVREQVAFALGQLRDPRAIEALTAALKDASADVRQQAAFALGQLAR